MPTSDFTPELNDVGALLRARTKDNNANEVGTFNTDTRPTGEEVDLLIADAVDEVASAIGPDVPDGPDADDPDTLRRAAKRATTLYTAMLVELSYFPEQVSSNRSPYEQIKALYDARMKTLMAAIENVGGVVADPGDGTGTGGGHPVASFDFPDDDNLVGWRTNW